MEFFSIEYRKFLVEHHIFDAWQYIVNARKNIVTAGYCCHIIEALVAKMETEHRGWQEDFNSNLNKQLNDKGIASMGISMESLPDFKIDMFGISVDYPFLIDKYIKDFFQYIRNSFDSMSQIINSSLLANNGISIEVADFNRILNELNKTAYRDTFTKTLDILKKIQDSNEFKYTSEFNNRVKHICDANLIMLRELFGDRISNKIKSFHKRGTTFSQQDIITITKDIFEYVGREFINFLAVVTDDIKQDAFVEGRFHQLKFYSQDIKNEPQSSFTAVFIEAGRSINEFPDTIRILLINDNDEDVLSINCDYEEILIRDENEQYLGKYVIEQTTIDEGILQYRKYNKVECDGLLAFFDQVNKNNAIKPYFMSGNIVRVGYSDSE